MSSIPLIDPEVLPLLELMPPLDFAGVSLPEMRAGFAAMQAQLPPPPLVPREVTAPGGTGAPAVPLLVFDPPGRTQAAAIYHIHGGGMVIGSAAGNTASCAALALGLGVLVVSVDYRLAPEHPFPAPQEDCLAGYDWLVGEAASLGIDPARIALTGESAGGGLAAALALMIRDTRRPAPCAQVLTYPMLDHRTGSPDHPALPHTGEFVWTAGHNRFGWSALRGGYVPDDARAGWFSPALAPDLAGLPPTWIGTGALDLFLAEDLAYAQRLVAAGVSVDLHVYAGCPHGFDLIAEATPSRAYRRDIRAAFARMLAL